MATPPPTTPQEAPSPNEATDTITLSLHHGPKTHVLTFPATATLSDLSIHVETYLSIPQSNQKFLISPKPGMLKPPFTSPPNSELALAPFASSSSSSDPASADTKPTPKTKITLLGSTPARISTLNATIATSSAPRRAGPIAPAKPARTHPNQETTQYTFQRITPLPYLPNPARSTAFLTRLATDPGIRATMTKNRWTVALLTEMDPAAHTTHSVEGVGRTLGLNRNRGAVIELRLRTDVGDGYRDYKTIRRTLCHELAHNVWGEHDGRFWGLCRRVEREVEAGDLLGRGGRTVGDQEYYDPGGEGREGERVGWRGGERVLGGAGSGGAEAGGSRSRREVMARAADEREKRTRAGEGAEPSEEPPDADRAP